VPNDNILGLSTCHTQESHDDLPYEIEAGEAAPAMAEIQEVANTRDTDPHHALKVINLPVSSRDAAFLAQWSNFTKDGMGSLKRGLSSAQRR
jgi:hypothetical protein